MIVLWAGTAGALLGSVASVALLKGSLLILLTFAASHALRSRAAATRSACWTALGVALLLLPGAAAVTPELSVPPVSNAIPAWVLEPSSPLTVGLNGHADPPQAEAVRHVDRPSVMPLVVRWIPPGLLSIWISGTALLLVGLGRGLWHVRMLRRRAQSLAATSCIARQASALAGDLAIARQVSVASSPEVDVPMTGGLLRPHIILPESCLSWDPHRLRAVMLHELAHVAHWDYAAHLLFEIVRALYWPNPLVWRDVSRATAERELAADDRVLAGGANAATYASELLAFAIVALDGPTRRVSLGLAPSALKARILAILRTDVNRSGPGCRDVGVVATIALLSLALVAALAPARAETNRSIVANRQATDIAFINQAAASDTGNTVTDASRPDSMIPRLGDPKRDSLLAVLWLDQEPAQRVAAARALRQAGDETPLVRVLVAEFADTCHAGRWRAARALRELAAEQALPDLVRQLLVDDHTAVRAMVANAIATSGSAHGASLLGSAMVTAPSGAFGKVVRALDTLGETPAHALLLTAVRRARRDSATPRS